MVACSEACLVHYSEGHPYKANEECNNKCMGKNNIY